MTLGKTVHKPAPEDFPLRLVERELKPNQVECKYVHLKISAEQSESEARILPRAVRATEQLSQLSLTVLERAFDLFDR